MTTEFDILIYGATGFTGSLASRYLTCAGAPPLRIALAGRNQQKLAKIAQSCEQPPTVVIADSTDAASVDAMIKRTRVVLSFAGPFALYGEPLIAACARYGRDYLDITGETPFIRRMIDRYQSEAVQNGARLVPFSGFDSVPADILVFIALKDAQSHNATLDDFKCYYTIRGGFNGGTLASALNMSQSEDKILYDPNSLILNSHYAKNLKPDLKPTYEPALKRWSAPFLMGSINRAVVRRSSWLSSQSVTFGYEERILVGKYLGIIKATFISGAFAAFVMLTSNKTGRALLKALGPKPGEGPSEKSRANGFFRGQLVGREKGRAKIVCTMERQGDPGNEITVALACESARLAAENAFIGDKKGFLTPSTAFGQRLVERLTQAGFRFNTSWY